MRTSSCSLVLLSLVALVLGPWLGGCATHRAGVYSLGMVEQPATAEVVLTTVSFLSRDELDTLAQNGTQQVIDERFPITLPVSSRSVQGIDTKVHPDAKKAIAERLAIERQLDGDTADPRFAPETLGIISISGIIAAVAGYLIDLAVKALRERAKKYTAEYVAASRPRTFPSSGGPKHPEALVIRTDRFKVTPSSRNVEWTANDMIIVYRFTNAARGPSAAASSRAVMLVPILVHVTKPQCRLGRISATDGQRFTGTYQVTLRELDSGRTFADDGFVALKLQVGKVLSTREELRSMSSPFLLDDSRARDLHATVRVTEVDQAHDAEVLNILADTLKGKKDTIIDIITTPLGPR